MCGLTCMCMHLSFSLMCTHTHPYTHTHTHTHTPIHTHTHTHTHTHPYTHTPIHTHTHTHTAQGVKAVIAESFERIQRSNLVGMGIVPLQYLKGQTAATLGLDGTESYSFELPEQLTPGQNLTVKVRLVCVV